MAPASPLRQMAANAATLTPTDGSADSEGSESVAGAVSIQEIVSDVYCTACCLSSSTVLQPEHQAIEIWGNVSKYHEDLDEVRALISLYVDGANGDSNKLRQAFHSEATMTGHIGDSYDTFTPISGFMSMVESNPGAAGPIYQATIQSIDLTGDAGVAVLAERDFFGCDFIDYFTVARIEGRWQIINKTYAHTGGQPPGATG
jgi:hypothetical protein